MGGCCWHGKLVGGDRKEARLMEVYVITHVGVERYPESVSQRIYTQSDVVIQSVTSSKGRKAHVPCPIFEIREILFEIFFRTSVECRDN